YVSESVRGRRAIRSSIHTYRSDDFAPDDVRPQDRVIATGDSPLGPSTVTRVTTIPALWSRGGMCVVVPPRLQWSVTASGSARRVPAPGGTEDRYDAQAPQGRAAATPAPVRDPALRPCAAAGTPPVAVGRRADLSQRQLPDGCEFERDGAVAGQRQPGHVRQARPAGPA